LYDHRDGTPPANIDKFVADNQNRLLAQMFPATSLALGGTGGQGVSVIGNKIDMNATMQTGWPQERGEETPWLHCDLRDVAYPYVHKLFDTFVAEGNLIQ
jgi:hypothetical protein